MTIRNRIIILYSSLTAATLLLLSIFIFLFTSHFATRNFYTRLKARASIAAHNHMEEDLKAKPVYEEVRKKHLVPLTGEKEYLVKVNSITTQIPKNDLRNVPPDFFNDILKNGYGEYKRGDDFFVGVYYKESYPDYLVILSAIDQEGNELLTSLRNLLIIGFIVCCVIIFIAAVLFSNQILNPISRIVEELDMIRASNLHLRLKPGNGKDELSHLANIFNNMLDRLEASFEMQSHFVSNASHELRTPLTTILGESEIILKRPRTTEEYIQALNTIAMEATKLDQLITSLLKMSQLGFDGKKLVTEKVQMDELLLAVKADLTRRIPNNNVIIEFSEIPENIEWISLSVNRMWMKLAIINIIHNAIKYSGNQKVIVKLSATEQLLEISVTDFGIGIPEEDIPHVFEPFYRGSNTTNYAGHGIGLPLSLKIIRLHHGRITINSDKDKGTTFSIYFDREENSL
jgi:signal transduction histidine kinase